jgi:hypothetical protein
MLVCFGLLPKAQSETGISFAKITVFGYQAGAPTITLGVQILKGIDNAARNGNADFGLRLTVTYVDQNNVVQTLDSGIMSIRNQTQFLNNLDNRTVLIQTSINFGATPQPGQGATFTGTAQVFSGNSIELGPAESTP